MPSFTLTHELDCDVDTFWKTFFDHDFNTKMFKEGLGFPSFEVVDQKDGEKEITRRSKVTPKMDVPGPVAKLLGASFTYTEDGTFDKASKVWRWKTMPSSMGDKVKSSGTVRVEPRGAGKCRRICDFDFEAKVFGLGGIIEGALEKNLRAGWDKSAEWMNRHFAENKT